MAGLGVAIAVIIATVIQTLIAVAGLAILAIGGLAFYLHLTLKAHRLKKEEEEHARKLD